MNPSLSSGGRQSRQSRGSRSKKGSQGLQRLSIQSQVSSHKTRSVGKGKLNFKQVAGAQGPTSDETDYSMHNYLLYFRNPDMEKKYFNSQYVNHAFIPGKIFAFAWSAFAFLSFFFFTGPILDSGAYMIESFSSLYWIGGYVHVITSVVMPIGLFIEVLKPYREIIHLAQIFVGTPQLLFVLVYTKRPEAYTYCLIFGCLHFCTVIAQARLHRSLPIVLLWPLVCLFTITFSIPDYWDNHTHIEMLYWLMNSCPAILLAILERRTRQSFVQSEQATVNINEIEHKTAVTQRMIANFFPATPTEDLLLFSHGPRDKAYPNTALIVTDIVGFTAHTSKSNPNDVIDMLTEMFRLFDLTALRYDVEKIATVGDSYCGAVFSKNLTSAARCTNAIQFSCSTFGFAGSDLQLRVGVHVGDVVGVFVGRAPPKFDLFGPGIDHARIMEETGVASQSHISNAVIDCVGRTLFSSFTGTDHGVLCDAWGYVNEVDDEEDSDYNGEVNKSAPSQNDHMSARDANLKANAKKIVQSLCAITGIVSMVENDVGQEYDNTTQGALTVTIFPDSRQGRGEGGSAQGADTSTDVMDEDYFDFSIIYLTFKHSSMERKFLKEITNNGIELVCAQLFICVLLALFFIQLLLQCTSDQDMIVTAVIAFLIAVISTYLQFFGTNHRFHAIITFVVYNCIIAVSFLALTGDCGGLALREKYIGDIAGCYFGVAIFASQYCLRVKLLHRCLLTIISSLMCGVYMAIRMNTVRDDVAKIDPLPLCGFVFIVMSFFPEYSIRSAFKTKMQLLRLQADAKSRGATMATSAMSIMLPTFVTENIIALAREGYTADASKPDANNTDELGDIDFNTVAATWDYPYVVLMFIKFHSDDPQFTPDAINMTVQAVEEIVKKFAVMKVKTIGSTIMLVTGIDDMRTRQEQVSGMVDAAIMIRACVFQEMNVDALSYRIGVHCGPCFGAVIGGNGAVFDLFGDTVNTASRMCSTASAGTIQLSSLAKSLVIPRLGDIATRCPPITVKGKGVMEVFSLGEDIDVKQLLPGYDIFISTNVGTLDSWRALYGKVTMDSSLAHLL